MVSNAGTEVVSTAAQGADTVMIASFANYVGLKIMADSSIHSIADLRGKTVAGGPAGSATDYAIRKVLRDSGLRPGVDVQISAGHDIQASLALLKSKQIQATPVTVPNNLVAQKEGAVELLDTTALNIPYQGPGLISTRTYVAAHRPATIGFLKGIAEAIHRFKTDENFAEGVMSKYQKKADQELLRTAWHDYLSVFPDMPYPTLPGLQAILDTVGDTKHRAEDLADLSLMKEVEDSGFFTQLQ
jgi:ABC-type nitrate/sulfonate/bicarbonate transport system substrate-binding protein